jgi:hypothetical protein
MGLHECVAEKDGGVWARAAVVRKGLGLEKNLVPNLYDG